MYSCVWWVNKCGQFPTCITTAVHKKQIWWQSGLSHVFIHHSLFKWVAQTWCLKITCPSPLIQDTTCEPMLSGSWFMWEKVEILSSSWFWKGQGWGKHQRFFNYYFVSQKTHPCGWFPIGEAVYKRFLTSVAIRPAATPSFLHQTNLFSCWSLQAQLEQYNKSIGWTVRQVGEANFIHF